MAIESRKVDRRRLLMAVTEMTDCGRWVCFGPQRQVFSFDPRTGQKIEFPPTPGGWDLMMKVEPPERVNKIMNKAIQEISAKRRAAARAKDYGAVTDTDGLVRIMISLQDRKSQQMTLKTISSPWTLKTWRMMITLMSWASLEV